MKKASFLIGLLSFVSLLAFSSCEKEADESQDITSTESELRLGEDDFDGEVSEERKKKFFAKLTDEEKAQMEIYKPTLESLKEKRQAYFATLDADTQEKLKSRSLTREEHKVIKEGFDATLSADEKEALDYVKSLKDKYRPEGAPKHPRR